MSRTFNGTTQYLSAASTLLADEPLSLLCWGNANNITAGHIPLGLGNNGASGRFNLGMQGNVGGDPIYAVKDNDAGTGAVFAASSTGYSATTWHHVAGVYRNNTSRDAYIDGGSKGSDTATRTDPTPDFISIGVLRTNTLTGFFDGSNAEAFLLDYALSDGQVALLGKGFHLLYVGVPLANIRGWYPLLGDDNNRMANGYPNLTPTASPTFSAHPPKIIPARLGSRMSL